MSEIATIKLDAEYFKKSRNEYGNDIKYIWIREAIQNSVDSGATEIEIIIDENSRWIHFVDNGCGMNEDILLNKLLTLGGSKKDMPDSVGGFGKAKEVLFFTWDAWRITTCMDKKHEYYICSDMIGNSPVICNEGNFTKGTRIEIQYDEEMNAQSWIHKIKKYVASCTFKADVHLNGELLEKMKMYGSSHELEWANARVRKKGGDGTLYVRVNGVTMFDQTLYETESTVILDLTKPSTEILTSSRESMKFDYRLKFNDFVKELLVNPESVFEKKQPKFVNQYLGESIIETINRMFGDLLDDGIITNEDITEIVQNNTMDDGEILQYSIANELEDKFKESPYYEPTNHSSNVIFETIKETDNVTYSPFGFEFITLCEGYTKPPEDVMTKKPQTVLHYWRNILVKFMELNEYTDDIGIGLLYHKEMDEETKKYNYKKVKAMATTHNGKRYLLINPKAVPSISNHLELGHYLFNQLTHEYAHLSYSDHNQHHSYLWGTYLDMISTNYNDFKKVFKESKVESKEILRNS